MATVISKASIHLSVNSGGVDVGLKKTGDGIKNFSERAKKNLDAAKNNTTSYAAESGQRLKGVGEQLGKVAAATGSLASLDLSRPQSVFAALQNTIAGVGSALETGANKAAIFRGALAATGIGLLVAGASALFNLLSGGGEERDRSTPEGFADSLAEESIRRRGRGATFGDHVLDRAMGRPTLASETTAATPGAGVATEAFRATAELGRAAAGMGLSAEAARIEEFRARLRELPTDTDAARLAFRSATHEIIRMADAIDSLEARRTAGSMESLAESMRHAAATTGMSSEEASVYRASLVRVTETVGGVTRTVERAMGPHELLQRRMADLNGQLARGAITSEEYRASLARAHEEARRHASALEDMRRAARELGMDRARQEAQEFTRAMEDAARNTGLSETEQQLRRLEESLRRAGVPAGELRTRMLIAGQAAASLADASDRVRFREADVSPMARAREELTRINDLRRRGVIDEGLRNRTVGRLLSGLAGSAAATELRGPQMLEAGSVEAERVLRDFRRGGAEGDPQEQMLRRLDESVAEERRQREAMERLARRFDEIGVAGL